MKIELRFGRRAPEVSDDIHTVVIEHRGKRYEIREQGAGLVLAVCEPIADQLLVVPGGSNTLRIYAGSERDLQNPGVVK